MAVQVQLRRGTEGQNNAFTGVVAELTVDTTNNELRVHDGSTAGGHVIGGGGLTNFTEAESTSSPNGTVSVDSLTAAAAATNADVALVAKGFGATLAQVPDGTTAGGNKRGQRATDFQKQRGIASQVASGPGAGILAGQSNQASGFYCSVVGGASNTASSNYSFVGGGESNEAKTSTHATCAGGSSNDATGQYSFVGGGRSNTATSSYATVGGGFINAASSSYATVSGGRNNAASSSYATVSGGSYNTASSNSSFISGGSYGTTRLIEGNHVFPACNAPIANTAGVTQSALLLLARQTTDATATVLASNSSAASTTNQVILPNNSAYSFSGEVIAGVTAAGDTARWTIDGAIKRGANAASTAMVGTPTVTMTHNDAGAAAWAVAVTANTTNGGIKVEVTGAAATTIRWVCKINTTEMTY